MTTLEQAVSSGKGTERTFHCPVHDDHNASASVNVIKGLWYCYACGARGSLDGMLEIDPHDLYNDIVDLVDAPELQTYPESWLALYQGSSAYWQTRFSTAAIAHFQLGYDPIKEKPCYPLRNPAGQIHGLVHRNTDEDSRIKYRYPFGSTITNYLFNYSSNKSSTVVLVEGAADAIACWEAGIEAFAILGSHISTFQAQLVRRCDPQRILLAFDQDTAGRQASSEVGALLDEYELVRAVWNDDDGKDPAELTELQRCSFIGSLVI